MNVFSVKGGVDSLQHAPKINLSESSADTLQRLKQINSSYFFRPEGYFFGPDEVLMNNLKAIDPIELKKVLSNFFIEMLEEDCITDPVTFLDRLAAVIPFEKLQGAVKDNVDDALTEAKGMFEEAKYYLQMTQENRSPDIQACISSILDGIISAIESIIAAFGIGDFFKPADSDMQADMKSTKITMMLSLFSMITTMILPLLEVADGGLIIGQILLGIATLSAIWPSIKPMTTHLQAHAKNWTKEVQNGCFVAQGRKESLNEIANIIKMKRHAILVGPSRVGKSLTAKAFVQAVERGDYPELKGKVVFCINTTDIVGHKASILGGGNNILNEISTAMGRHRDDIILVLDEAHMACKNNEKIADQLKTFLDENGEFPHVIAITTEEEYEKYVKENTAFSLRFDKVEIKNTSQDETLKILGDTLLKSRSKPMIKEDTLDYIYSKTSEDENAPQPSTSLKLLKRCINKTEKTQASPTEKKIIEVSNKINSLRSQAAASRGRKKDVKVQIAELEKQIVELKEALSKEQKDLDKLFKSKDLLDQVTKETYLSVLRISASAQKTLNSQDKKQLNLFLFLHEFLGKSLESHIEAKSKTLGVKAVIDKELIDESKPVLNPKIPNPPKVGDGFKVADGFSEFLSRLKKTFDQDLNYT
jgi:uncharacterized coiled-coil protein SlyX